MSRLAPNENSALLFVYGTLKSGHGNNHFLDGQQLLGPAQTVPSYRLYVNDWYPCLVTDTQQGIRVQGEVWRVAAQALARMDEYESVPTWFTREPVALEGYQEVVWAYFFQGEVTSLPECADGAWPPK